VEQQGKSVEELDAQKSPAWWEAEQHRVQEINAKLVEYRKTQKI
jgi:hypothetical protein